MRRRVCRGFVSIDAAPWFTWFSVKPYGSGHFIQGLSVSNNVFKAIDGQLERIEMVDTTFAALDNSRMRNVVFEANTFNGVTQMTVNPVSLQADQASAQAVWTVAAAGYLPFGGWARNVSAIVAEGPITNAAGGRINGVPYVTVEQGAGKQAVTLTWQEAVKGRVHVRLRMDNPN